PREVQVTPTFDQLGQVSGQHRRIRAPYQVLRMHARGVRQRVVGAGLDRLDGGAGVEMVERGAWQRLAVCGVHAVGGLLREAVTRRCTRRPARGDRRAAGRVGAAETKWRNYRTRPTWGHPRARRLAGMGRGRAYMLGTPSPM